MAMKTLASIALLSGCVWLCAARVEEPPRDPIDCVFCGGNPIEHAKRMVILQAEVNAFAYRLILH
ncbi:MAG: hypothetical protein RL277_775 [Planctomycetota bacterium]|jgi:hypothetical protein